MMKKIALMFPGQGSQTVGMGLELYEQYDDVKQLYKTANDVLEKDLQGIMFEGPQEVLTETENTQPALLLASTAVYTLLKQESIKPTMVVGHSLGEYSALVAAGALTVEEALPLVQTRGRLMEKAYPKGKGTMAAVLGMDEAEIAAVLENIEDEIVDIANLNCPGQIVISGSKAGVDKASELLKEAGARRVLPLNVSGPFHSRLMKDANEAFQTYLDQTSVQDAQIPVYANVTAEAVQDKAEIKQLLIEQLYSPVRFEQSIRNMMEIGVDAFVEIGVGSVLSGLVRKVDRKAKTFAIQDIESLEKFLSWYKEDA